MWNVYIVMLSAVSTYFPILQCNYLTVEQVLFCTWRYFEQRLKLTELLLFHFFVNSLQMNSKSEWVVFYFEDKFCFAEWQFSFKWSDIIEIVYCISKVQVVSVTWNWWVLMNWVVILALVWKKVGPNIPKNIALRINWSKVEKGCISN